MKKIIYIFSFLFVFAGALPALAATNFKTLVNDIILSGLLKPIIPLIISLAVVVFIYGVFTMMFSEGGEKKEEGKQYMIWGIVGLFVMISVWGLVNILITTFGLNNSSATPIRITVPSVSSSVTNN